MRIFFCFVIFFFWTFHIASSFSLQFLFLNWWQKKKCTISNTVNYKFINNDLNFVWKRKKKKRRTFLGYKVRNAWVPFIFTLLKQFSLTNAQFLIDWMQDAFLSLKENYFFRFVTKQKSKNRRRKKRISWRILCTQSITSTSQIRDRKGIERLNKWFIINFTRIKEQRKNEKNMA